MRKSNIFWIGYSDLMTSLFFVMLVLFVVTVGFLNYKIKTTEEELEKIRELQTAVQNLPKEFFEYQPQYKRFKLKEHVQFDTLSSKIKPKYHDYLIKVGRSIESLVDSLSQNEELDALDIKYLLIIEGMASMDTYQKNYELSYERALSLYRFWKENGIVFDPEACEIQISGSGTGGIREYKGDEEYLNRQFLIHIIPKLGALDLLETNLALEDKEKKTTDPKVIQVLKSTEAHNVKPINKEIPINWSKSYDSVGVYDENEFAIVRSNGKFGFVNNDGKVTAAIKYDNIIPTEEKGLYLVVENQKIGIIKGSGELITAIKYDGIGQWSEGFAVVFIEDKCGYINIQGQEVISVEYSGCENFKSGRAKVEFDGREIYVNSKDKYVGEVNE